MESDNQNFISWILWHKMKDNKIFERHLIGEIKKFMDCQCKMIEVHIIADLDEKIQCCRYCKYQEIEDQMGYLIPYINSGYHMHECEIYDKMYEDQIKLLVAPKTIINNDIYVEFDAKLMITIHVKESDKYIYGQTLYGTEIKYKEICKDLRLISHDLDSCINYFDLLI
jgi:hypothetical protein